MIRSLSLLSKKRIIPGQTLLFLDEIQIAPRALTALRYFYEKMPDLHVIAAGSLINFATREVGIPVGRVESLYLYPMSFLEFLVAIGHHLLAEEILTDRPLSEPMHDETLSLLGIYLAIGGMPEAVKSWAELGDPTECFRVHQSLIETYKQDFRKYAQEYQIKYIRQLFHEIPKQLSRKFKYTAIEGNYRKRDLSPCLDLLMTAGIAHQVTHSAGHGTPLGAEVKPDRFKCLFLDTALSQATLGLDLIEWFLGPKQAFINKGEIVEAFVGQELLAYANPQQKAHLFYWQQEARSGGAKIGYLHASGTDILPIEVKSGKGTSLRSLHSFLDKRPELSHGVRFSTQNYSFHQRIQSYPLYSVARLFAPDRFYQLLS